MAKEPEILFEGKYIRVACRNGWEFAERRKATGAVIIVAVTEAKEIILVEQYREPLHSLVIELPAGLVGDLEENATDSIEEAAIRELWEETGYTADSVERLVTGPPSAGLASEVVTFVRAKGLKRIGRGGGTGNEKITVSHVPLTGTAAWLDQAAARGTLIDPKVFAGLYFATLATS
jgi:ADP-ribose pyrophosphatase